MFVCSGVLLAQEGHKRSNVWLLGGDSGGGGLKLDFNKEPVEITYEQTGVWMRVANTSICSENGEYLFASNGVKVANALGVTMLNGDSITSGFLLSNWPTASPLQQGVLALPKPGSNEIYYVFALNYELPFWSHPTYSGFAPTRLNYHTIDMREDGGLGAVVEKHQVALQDTLARGSLIAARHANGCDWWVIIPEIHSNCYYRILVTEEGVQPAQKQCLGKAWSDLDAASAVFSPDLKKYVRFNAFNGMHIFDFDNWSGQLSRPRKVLTPMLIEQAGYFTDVAISPNSQYAYVMGFTKAYQYNLDAEEIGSTVVQVAEWDGTYNPYATIFNSCALAPDGKIYVGSSSSTFNLHVIEKPDLPGLACEFVQRAVDLPSYNHAGRPNHPYYGDPEKLCEVPVATEEEESYSPVAVYPNPASEVLWVNYPTLGARQYTFQLFNLQGQRVYRSQSGHALQQYDISYLPVGTYFYTLEDSDGTRWSGKVQKVE